MTLCSQESTPIDVPVADWLYGGRREQAVDLPEFALSGYRDWPTRLVVYAADIAI